MIFPLVDVPSLTHNNEQPLQHTALASLCNIVLVS